MNRTLLALFLLLSACTGTDAPLPAAIEAGERPLDTPVLEASVVALSAYETVRAMLAADRIDGIAAPALAAASALGGARAALGHTDSALATILDSGVTAAGSLAAAPDLATARLAFGELSRALLPLSARDARLRDGRHVFSCPMAAGFQQWVQSSPQLENPYMGQAMLKCGTAAEWPSADVPAPTDVAYYTCSMHPSVKSSTPGTCPICSMDLTPVTHGSLATGEVVLDPVRRQAIGVTTTKVERRAMSVPIRAVGTVTYDQSALSDVTVRIEGWVEAVYVDEPGQRVLTGQPLFSIYSPELYAAQAELLQSQRGGWASEGLGLAARERLRLWGLSESQVQAIAERGATRTVDIPAPASGFVIEKDVVAGARVEPGDRLFRLAGLGKVWVEAEVYEADLPRVKAGQRATVKLSHGELEMEGKVSRVLPYLAGATRTGRVRVELQNEKLDLLPEMFAEVELHEDTGTRLVVPRDAVIYTGPRRLVFVDLGEGRLVPREVRLGLRGREEVEVLEGLAEGDTVVASGNFLVAAESRMRSATGYWGGTDAVE